MRYIIFILFVVSASSAFSQQGAILKPLELDSTLIDFEDRELKNQMITGSLFTEPFNTITGITTQLPHFNFNQNNSLKINFNQINGFPLKGFSFGNYGTYHSPFFNDVTIISQEAYNFGDKFIVGGYSYGANSIFSPPLQNPNSTNFDAYGKTLFMQYKVSKNLKIETRFNVTTGPGNGF